MVADLTMRGQSRKQWGSATVVMGGWARQIHGDHEPAFTEVIQFGPISLAFEMLTGVLGDGAE